MFLGHNKLFLCTMYILTWTLMCSITCATVRRFMRHVDFLCVCCMECVVKVNHTMKNKIKQTQIYTNISKQIKYNAINKLTPNC